MRLLMEQKLLYKKKPQARLLKISQTILQENLFVNLFLKIL